jgi:hypothetical protein
MPGARRANHAGNSGSSAGAAWTAGAGPTSTSADIAVTIKSFLIIPQVIGIQGLKVHDT